MNIGTRIRESRKAKGLSQKQLGDRLGVSEKAISQWENDATIPRTRRLQEIGRILEIDWTELTSNSSDHTIELTVANSDLHFVPLIDFIRAGAWGEVVDPYPQGGYDEMLWTEKEVSSSAFGLIIEGDSMSPQFQAGDKIIVDPSVQPKPGDYVVAKLAAREEATFKKYRPRGFSDDGTEIIELAPLNSDWPTLYIDKNNPGQIVGTVIEHRRFLK